jgi:hypothetical protein
VYLRAYASVSQARKSMGGISNDAARIRALTPDQAYFGHKSMLPIRLAA